MFNKDSLIHKIDTLAENDLQEVDDFVDFILQKRNLYQSNMLEEPSEIKTGSIFGSAKGFFKSSDDFNDPLDDFKEYME